jgi:hypothetical protein
MVKFGILIVTLVISAIFSACASNVVITPDLAIVRSEDFSLRGKIDYEGNAEYLPRTVSAETYPGAALLLRYRYEVTYGRDAVHQALPLFNPLTIVGFPIGSDTVVVTAKLEVLKGSSEVKTYTAVCILNKSRTVFWEGETLSELRRRGLLAIRENIETQMHGDRDVLLKAGLED